MPATPKSGLFLAAAELLTMPILDALIRPFKATRVRRGRFDRHAFEACLGRLGRGESLAVFPEGKISTDGQFHPARDGLGLIACHAP